VDKPVRVLVVDDSALMRKLIPQIIERDPSIHVVGTAMDGTFVLKKIEELKPDVITLDLEMPRMDGMETLKQIMRHHQMPVIVVSAHSIGGASSTFKALALGAFDFVTKPADGASAHIDEIAGDLIRKIKAATAADLACRPVLKFQRDYPKVVKPARPMRPASKVVGIGVSTGGPNSVQYVLSQLPAEFPAAIVIVQHMPENFTEMFARRLDETCAIEVKEAQSGDLLLAGRALVCPGNKHVKVRRMALGDIVVLTDDEKVNGHRPSVDVLFRSIAKEFGPNGVAVIMTGMGEDGAEGMGLVKAAGGVTIAQSEESCIVYGMPRAAIERGYASRVVGLDTMAHTIQAQFRASPNGAAHCQGNKEECRARFSAQETKI
jgi:two-component system, chemotaxis family, protein-glutamate methylesterase/glutaminase